MIAALFNFIDPAFVVILTCYALTVDRHPLTGKRIEGLIARLTH